MGPAPHEQRSRRSMRFRLRRRMTMGVGAGAVALALVAAGCSSSSTTGGTTTGTKVQGGTAVWAEPPATVPNYIFPFTSSAYISIVNAAYFTNLMYRPLYWFGNGSQPQLGGGWTFAPDYSPIGETLFMCGAIANSGGYCSKTNDNYITQTLTTDNPQGMYTWQNYLSTQLPVMFQPNSAYALTEVANNLKGALPQSPTLYFNPETWYFVK